MAVHLVLLAGGRGTRFWPLSRRKRPKQFLPLLSDESMLRQTWRRVAPLGRPERTWIVTGADLKRACAREIPELDPTRILTEPEGRNTAAAIALAAVCAGAADPKAVLGVFPSDHFIADLSAFRRIARRALACAREEGSLVTLGVKPSAPSTGYGYIETGRETRGDEILPVLRFVEKPDQARARRFASDGRHLWNSGMFFFSVRALSEAFAACAPEIWEPLRALAPHWGKSSFARRLRGAYTELPALPFDVAVMEKAERRRVLPADMGWSDVGHWETLGELLTDDQGNRIAGEVYSLDAKGNIVMAPEGLTALLGVEDLLVVRAGDAVLVCRRDRARDLRELVTRLEHEGLARYL